MLTHTCSTRWNWLLACLAGTALAAPHALAKPPAATTTKALQQSGILDVGFDQVQYLLPGNKTLDPRTPGVQTDIIGDDENGQFLDCGLDVQYALQFLPPEIQLTGVVRDFVGRNDNDPANGLVAHPDFEISVGGPAWSVNGDAGYLHPGDIVQVAADELDEDEKPAFRSRGMSPSIAREFVAQSPGRPAYMIGRPKPYIAWRATDSFASTAWTGCSTAPRITQVFASPSSKEALEAQIPLVPTPAVVGADRFAQWYRDVPGVNLSTPLTITLRRVVDTSTNTVRYTFDDRQDPFFQNLGGFYPINDQLFGNGTGYACGQSQGSTNNHFTFELDTTFIYRQGCNQQFTFEGDDDLWVFIDGKLVIDLSGTHCVRRQTIDIDRLTWLQDRHPYQLKVFSAERNRCGSNLRIDTNLSLRTTVPPQTTGLFD